MKKEIIITIEADDDEAMNYAAHYMEESADQASGIAQEGGATVTVSYPKEVEEIITP